MRYLTDYDELRANRTDPKLEAVEDAKEEARSQRRMTERALKRIEGK